MKKICIVTGSRAEYGLLKNLIIGIKNDKLLKLQLIVTGSHLSRFHGQTFKEIVRDGIKINTKVYLPIKKNNNKFDIAKLTAIAITKFTDAFKALNPDIVILLGDRYEIFAAAYSAMNGNTPIGHIHGGEKTLGSLDESMRHAITKMSKLHFVSNLSHRKRVIQLGELPRNVYNVGALSYESIQNVNLLSKTSFEKKINLKLQKNNFLVVYHPETSGRTNNSKTFDNILNSLKKVKSSTFIFTLSNADAESGKINDKIIKFVKKNKISSVYFTSMGQELYYTALKHCSLLIGNSSSGIIEAPYFKTPSINIGARQVGRISSKSVIHSKKDKASISQAINKALKMNLSGSITLYNNPYGKKFSSKKIMSILKKINFKKLDTRKAFYDINQ